MIKYDRITYDKYYIILYNTSEVKLIYVSTIYIKLFTNNITLDMAIYIEIFSDNIIETVITGYGK